ncbi:cysteine peptidase family C39 domain-containing protein [Streptomyces sp. NPDC006996]|uniref:cysteine peptidase family C39 domain-containing protein n=1 Tax=Streptomyces sp. NPDC006996 TaxID=3156908 RepID=UPI0033F27201
MSTARESRGRRRAAPPKRKVPASRTRAVRTPTVLQMEAVECGAASLAMVLGHYGRHVPLEELRIACGVSRDGSRASNLLKAARSYGLTAKGMQMDLAALAEVATPAVLFWEFNHYVVYDGMGRRFGRRGVYINDPGKGRRFIPLEEFDGSYTGVVLVMEPGADFTRGGRRPGVLGAMPARLRGTAGTMPAVVLSSLLLVAVGAAVPGLSRTFIDEFLIGGRTSTLDVLFTAMGACVLLTLVLTWLQQGNLLRGRLISSTLSSARFLRHLLRLPVTFFAQRSPADLVQRLQSNDAVAETLARDLSAAGVDALVVVLYALLLYTYDPQLTFVGIGVALLNIVAMRVVIRSSRFARSREFQQRAGRIKNLTAVLGAVYLPLCTLVMFMLLAGPARGSMTAAEFLTFNTAVTMVLTSVTQLTGAFVSAVAALPLFEQIRPVLDATPEVRAASTRPGPLSGAVEARRLSFRYSDDGPLVLDDVSVDIRPGEFVAVVGPSGCGKSTLLRLLIGFDRPESGSVLYDGQELATLDRSAVRRQCGVVLQHAQPFSGSVLDVICGTEPYTPEEAMAAAEMAGLADDIRRMPMGLHTIVSGSGAVSGGQRQRLMIAQALIRRPRILFFDEATSALDNETQRTVIESTKALEATRIVIAHRLSTVLDADRVVVMEGGKVVQQGPPARLLADTGGRLHELVRRQLA